MVSTEPKNIHIMFDSVVTQCHLFMQTAPNLAVKRLKYHNCLCELWVKATVTPTVDHDGEWTKSDPLIYFKVYCSLGSASVNKLSRRDQKP